MIRQIEQKYQERYFPDIIANNHPTSDFSPHNRTPIDRFAVDYFNLNAMLIYRARLRINSRFVNIAGST